MADDTLVVAEPQAAPMQMLSGEQMAEVFTRYQGLQGALDRSMPDQIMTIGEKRFRKKGYWRAIAVAFGLSVEPEAERREVHGQFHDGTDNFGYLLTYRASAPNGRFATGDGSAFAIEKAPRFKCPHPTSSGRYLHYPFSACPAFDPAYAWHACPPEATEHNVRSHAHTRAFNRAVSNLVGFGEVSAEEADYSARYAPPEVRAAAPLPQPGEAPLPVWPADLVDPAESLLGRPGDATITPAQAKRLWAIAKGKGWSSEGIRAHLGALGYEHHTDVPRRIYDKLIVQIETQDPR